MSAAVRLINEPRFESLFERGRTVRTSISTTGEVAFIHTIDLESQGIGTSPETPHWLNRNEA